MEVLHLDSQNFKEEVLNADKIVLVDFYADWCGPCKMMAPVVEKLAKELGDKVKVCKINIDEALDIATEYEVMSIPTFIAFKQGNISKRTVGVQALEELKELVE